MSNDFSFDDDDDDRPKRRAKGRRDDDEDRPQRRSESRRDENDDDDDDTPPRRRSDRGRASAGKSWVTPFRFITPGTFGMAILFFFLPWSDLNCSGPTGKMQLFTQSGLQAALGEVSEGDGLDEMRKEQGPKGKQGGNPFNVDELRKNPPGAKGKGKDDGPPTAPLLWVYLLLLFPAAIVPVLLAHHRLRGAIVLGLAGLALFLLLIQTVVGFPLANTASDFNAEMKKGGPNDLNFFGPPGKAGGGGGAVMRSSFLPAFWLTLLLLMASAGIGLLQLVAGGMKPAPKRRRDPDDDDDEPAPRRRRRDDDDDDDEPAPKRRRRRDEDDD